MSLNIGNTIINAPLYIRGVGSLIATNYSVSRDENSVTVTTSDGSEFTLNEATSLLAGMMSAADKAALDSLIDDDPVNSVSGNYIIYAPSENATENEATFLAAYTAAATLTPNELALSSGNRATLIILPGQISIAAPVEALPYVNVIGISDVRLDFDLHIHSNQINLRNLAVNNIVFNIDDFTEFSNCTFSRLTTGTVYGNAAITNYGVWDDIVATTLLHGVSVTGLFTNCTGTEAGFTGTLHNIVNKIDNNTAATPSTLGLVKVGDGLIIDGDGVLSSSIINDLITGGTTVPLSAQQGVVLKDLVDGKASAGDLAAHTTDTDIHHTAASLNARDTANRNRANHTGTQAQSTVVNLVTDLADKAPLASPALTGTPTAPTATAGTNTTQLATTAFVTGAISTNATADRNRANHTGTQAQSTVTNLVTDLATKAPLASPALTGTPTAPTATAGTNTTQIATTAFVTGAVATNATADRARANHTGTQAQSTVDNLVTDLAAKIPIASIVNDLTTGGTAVPLSAQQGVALKAYVDGKLPLVTTEYIVYVPSADPIANDATFRAALTAAAALTPNGLALSATNRATVLCAPGTVQLGSDLTPPNFVDIVGLGSPDDFKIPLASYRIYLTETITHVRYSNFSTRIRLYPTVSHSFENCLFEDLELRGADGNSNVENWGTWKRIKGSDSSTNLFVMTGPIYGHFEDCETGGFILSETFGSASFYGTAIRCKGGAASFARYNMCAGTLIDCTGGDYSFGGYGTFSGKATGCIGGTGSFGGGGVFSGTATGCTGGDNSFGGNDGNFSGTATGCIGGHVSFGGAGAFSGAATGCTGGEGCFAGEGGFFEGTPRITNCVAGSSSFGTSAGTPVDFSGATSVLVKDCRLTDDSFTNLDAKYKVRSCINADLSESNYN